MKYKEQNRDRSAVRRDEERGAYDTATPNEGIISGRNAVKELLASNRDIDKIYVARGDREGSIVALAGEAVARKIPLIECDRKKLDTLCGHNRHQGIVAMAAERAYASIDDMLALAAERGESPLLVIADGIEDPHNLGALMRCAECAGAHGLIIPKRRSVGLTSVVAKASAGAIEHLPIAKVTNLATTIDELKEKYPMYAPVKKALEIKGKIDKISSKDKPKEVVNKLESSIPKEVAGDNFNPKRKIRDYVAATGDNGFNLDEVLNPGELKLEDICKELGLLDGNE